ncbi:hypothetical protein VNO77_03562 [Canavalia gladiata]|uniref:Uncharacterized protein n=1 Tax=Canavalia gladiata TaxID=3824 RepID=A0AAN9N0L1_CANGL
MAREAQFFVAERKSYGFWYVSIVEIRSKQDCRHGSKHTCDARDGWETQAPPMECNSSLCSPSYGLLSGFEVINNLPWLGIDALNRTRHFIITLLNGPDIGNHALIATYGSIRSLKGGWTRSWHSITLACAHYVSKARGACADVQYSMAINNFHRPHG